MANGNVRQIVQPPTPIKITQIALMQEHWRANGAEVLMSGRIGDSIEFYSWTPRRC